MVRINVDGIHGKVLWKFVKEQEETETEESGLARDVQGEKETTVG